MINKNFKIIHNKYLGFFKFIFFLRYLFVIFFVAIALFLTIPNFFEYDKRLNILKNHLSNYYDLKLISYDHIEYNAFPTPNLVINDVKLSFDYGSQQLFTSKLKIYPKLINIYNFEDFESRKVIFHNNKISINIFSLGALKKLIFEQKNKFDFNNLEIEINSENESLINLKEIYYSNYGYKKNVLNGIIFNKKFKTIIGEEGKKINLKILNSGIVIDLNFIDDVEVIKGVLKTKILSSNLKFDFKIDEKKIIISKAYFRNKNLSFTNQSIINYNPFFKVNSNFELENIRLKLFKDFDIYKIIQSKELIKKINSKNIIQYKPKKFRREKVEDFYLNLDFAYGRLKFSKNLKFFDSKLNCSGNTNLLEDYPILFFNCFVISNDKKKFLKRFSIKHSVKNEPLQIDITGSLNILENKINFKKIIIAEQNEATQEDLKFYANSFQNILINKNIFDIFDYDKIKDFILEIY